MEIDNLMNLRGKTIVIGGDHHARQLAEKLFNFLRNQSTQTILVKYNCDCEDYISQAFMVASMVSQNPNNYAGIIGCKTGFGTTLLSNKFPNVFAVRCDNHQQAASGRKVNYANVLAFGSDFVDEYTLFDIVNEWLDTDFEINEKNRGRLARIYELEKELYPYNGMAAQGIY